MIIRLIVLYGLYMGISLLHEGGHRLFLAWGHYSVKDWRIGSAPWILRGRRWRMGIVPGVSQVRVQEPIRKVGHRLGMSLSGVGLVAIVTGIVGSLLWSVAPIILVFGGTTICLDMMPWPPIMDGAKTMSALKQSVPGSLRLMHGLCILEGVLMGMGTVLGLLLMIHWAATGRL